MTRLQVALSAAMTVHDLAPVLIPDANVAMAVTGAFTAALLALVVMLVDSARTAWRNRKGGRSWR